MDISNIYYSPMMILTTSQICISIVRAQLVAFSSRTIDTATFLRRPNVVRAHSRATVKTSDRLQHMGCEVVDNNHHHLLCTYRCVLEEVGK